MGNCVGFTTTPPPPLPQRQQPHDSIQQPKVEDYAHYITKTPVDTPFIGTPDLMGTGTGTAIRSSSPAGNNAVVSVNLLDPRLMSLLDFFRQLCTRKIDIFEKIIPVHQKDFQDIFKGIVEQEDRNRKRLVMQRSNSFGDVEIRSRRFKVKPIDSGGATPSGGGGGGGADAGGKSGGSGTTNKPGGSK